MYQRERALWRFDSWVWETAEIEVGSGSGDVVMMQDIMSLNELVVTALGVSKEQKALAYSVSEVDGGEVVSSGEQNVIQGIAAKAPGVQVIGSGGTPGASSKVLIRGNATFTGNNQPLIVVDGVPIDNSTKGTVCWRLSVQRWTFRCEQL